MRDEILSHLQDPHELERLYRRDPQAFSAQIKQLHGRANGEAINIWYERLFFSNKKIVSDVTNGKKPAAQHQVGKDVRENIFLVVGTSLFAGILLELFTWGGGLFGRVFGTTMNTFGYRFIPFAFLSVLTLYFIIKHRPEHRVRLIIEIATVLLLVYVYFLPSYQTSQTSLLAFIHVPLILWALLALSFIGRLRHRMSDRLNVLTYNGEALIYFGIFAACGIFLTVLTINLFSFAAVDITNLWFNYVVIFGVAAAPIIATALTLDWFGKSRRIAPIVARLFSPVLLVTLFSYLVTLLWSIQSLFKERELLLMFNVMLISVLAVILFVTSERASSTWFSIEDSVAAVLVAVALIINAIALSAISFRLASYGISPNRLTVLGENILIFINLIGILAKYIKFFLKKSKALEVGDWIARYLPVYIIWALVVVLLFPLFFRFQ